MSLGLGHISLCGAGQNYLHTDWSNPDRQAKAQSIPNVFEGLVKLFAKKFHTKVFPTEGFWPRLSTLVHYIWTDHAYLRLMFDNAHWIDEKMVRTNQPWPFQLKKWQDKGIKTVITLRGGKGSFYYLEKWACEKYGLTFEEFGLTSRGLPTGEEIKKARALFDTLSYPALMHCKSGADRAGMMAVLYRHLHLGHPISEAVRELDWRYLHFKAGQTGVLDYLFEYYLAEIAPTGLSFYDWTQSEAYDPVALKANFKASWWGSFLTEKLLRRE